MNNDATVDGILLQLPLPGHLSQYEVELQTLVSSDKDADGFHPLNLGKLLLGSPYTMPCTPLGVMKMLEHAQCDLCGKNVVVLGRSNIVGKPFAVMAGDKTKGANGTVTIVHSKTNNIQEVCKQADVLVAAIGKPKFVTSGMFLSS